MMCALGKALSTLGYRFVLVSSAAENATWVDLVRSEGIELHIVRSANQAAAVTKSLKPDIVHCHFAGFEIATTLKLLSSSARVFWHEHSSRAPRRKPLPYLKSLLKNRVLGKRVELFLPVSNSLAEQLKRWGVPPRKLKVVLTAINTEWYRPPTHLERQGARASLTLQEDERAILFFGRDSYTKGGDFLAAALKLFPSVTVLVVGADDALVASLQSACKRVVRIDWLENVRNLYWAADRLVMPSRREGMPFTLLEGASCGLPALTSMLDCFREAAPEIVGLRLCDVENASLFSVGLSETTHERFPAQHRLIAGKWSMKNFVNTTKSIYLKGPKNCVSL